VLLLIYDPGEEPGVPPPRRRRPRPPPWRPFAWFAAFCWLLYIAGAIDGLVGYLLLLVAIAVGCWRVDRWLGKQYWGGLREIQR
jgi:hypothetical protein